jgi:hypothetical protein
MAATDAEVLAASLGHLREMMSDKLEGLKDDLSDLKSDVKELKDGSPIFRIQLLEEEQKAMVHYRRKMRFMVTASLVGALSSLVVSLILVLISNVL